MDKLQANNKIWNIFLKSLYECEINVNRNIQNQFEFAEPLLRNINDYLDPMYILNLWVPLAGCFDHKLLVQLVSSLGLINTLVSIVKWCFPEFRPVWWIKENAAIYKYDFKDIKIDPFSCDTSGGFPSIHATAFTTFILIVVWRFVKYILSSFDATLSDKYTFIYAIASLLSAFLWFTRLYFLYEFLHQCLIGSLFAVVMIHVLKRFSQQLIKLRKFKALLMVFVFGLIPISAYFAMLYIDVDPFWSVRMAFKWCADPLNLKHESTPVFMLCRDFGYLMGLALSCPLAKTYDSASNNCRSRLPILLVMEMINAVICFYTPKQYGRFIFVAYEFLRNCMHSFMLLSILPNFVTK